MKKKSGYNDNVCISDMLYYSKATTTLPSFFQLVPISARKQGSKKVISTIKRQMVTTLVFMSFVWILVYKFVLLLTHMIGAEWNYYCIVKTVLIILISLYYALSIIRFNTQAMNKFQSFLSEHRLAIQRMLGLTIKELEENTEDDDSVVYEKLLIIDRFSPSEINRKARIKRLRRMAEKADYTWNYETDSLIPKVNMYDSDLMIYLLLVCKVNPYCLGMKSRSYILSNKYLIRDNDAKAKKIFDTIKNF